MDNSVGRTAQSHYAEVDGKQVRIKRLPMKNGKKKFTGKSKDNSVSVFDKFSGSIGGSHKSL